MKGFKNSTKMMMRHDCGPETTKAGGGLVIPKIGGGMGGGMRPSTPPIRPIMPRPRVMPNIKMASMRPARVYAKGGAVEMTGKRATGNTLEQRGGKTAYSETQKEFPDNHELRPGYKTGGIHIKKANKGKFTKRMTGSKKGKLTNAMVSKGLHSKSGEVRKEANFARMARRGFKPLCEGGKTGYAEGGKVRRIAKEEVARHVATPKPAGHGLRNLAFMRKPLVGED